MKTSLVVEAIAKAENFEVTDEDLEKRINVISEAYGMEVDAVRNALSKDMLEHDIVLKKALDLITESAKEA